MEDQLTISISVIKPVLQYAVSKGIYTDVLLTAAEIDPLLFETPEARLTIDEMDRIYWQAMHLTGDKNLGLHVGECYVTGSINIVGHVFMSCRTIAELQDKFVEYTDIVSEAFKINIDIDAKTNLTVIEYTTRHAEDKLKRQHIDCMFCVSITLLSALTGTPIKPLEVRFKHKPPDDISEHQRVFQAPLLFDQPMNALVFDSNVRDIPILQPNPELLFLFEQHARKVLGEVRSDKTYTKKVSLLLMNKMQEEPPNIDVIAKNLAMSVRNLQKKLEKENTTYRAIFTEVSKKLAMSYLENKELSISEIAYLLGFSEPSVFHRSFKRWTGQTPTEYRTAPKTAPI